MAKPHGPDTGNQLERVLNLPLLTLYGLGTTIGAGIYALIGEIAGVAGYGAPLAFLIAALVAGLTACSFAELAARLPRAAGAALYVQEGFGSVQLARLVGLLVALAGVVSAAALVDAFTGYLQTVLDLERVWIVVGVTVAVGALVAWGIAESATVAAVITVVEVGGLLVVIGAGADAFRELPQRAPDFLPLADGPAPGGILLGVTLAFYAFIGFEDMVDVAEEVKSVRRTMPRAIMLTLGLTTVLYLLLVVVALMVLPPAELAASPAPITTLFEAATGRSPVFIGVVAMFAIINGALVQVVMASRVLYGLSARGQLPALLGRVHARTRTPLVATGVATAAVLALALYGRLAGLATLTSVLMLTVFALVDLALWRLKAHGPPPDGVWEVPRRVPLAGFVASSALVAQELLRLL